MAQLEFRSTNFRLWSERFKEIFTDDMQTGPAYMAAWNEGAKQMLEFLQAEASEGTDPLRNIGDYEDIQPSIVPVSEGIYEDLKATDPGDSIILVPEEFPN